MKTDDTKDDNLDSRSLHSLEGMHDAHDDNDDAAVTRAERERERQTLARKEDRAVRCLRIMVLVVLLLATCAVALFVYNYVDGDQTTEFETEFEAYASKVIETFQTTMARKVEGIDALATSITSYAIATNSTFPFVTMPDFELRAANTRVMADVSHMNWYPLVENADRRPFEAYINERRGPVWDAALASENAQRTAQNDRLGYTAQEESSNQGEEDQDNNNENRNLQAFVPQTEIYVILANGTRVPRTEGSGPFAPIWQMSPAIPGFQGVVLYDTFTQPDVGDVLREAHRSGKAVMDSLSHYEGIEHGNAAAFVKLTLAMGQYRFNGEELFLNPSTGLAYPVFDSFDRTSRTVVGFLGATLNWKFYLQNILPPNARGIHCVLSNTDNETMTYRIDGHQAEYVGFADLHDPKYDSHKRSSTLGDYVQGLTSAASQSYTSTAINFEHMDYTVTVYPSQDTEDQFRNNDPWVFTLIIVGVFFFTSMVFVTYDCLVARRQKIVKGRAVASSAIVASLYPSQVRDQIYNETDNKAKGKGDDQAVKNLMSGGEAVSTTRRNAHVYESTTIL